MRSLQVALPHVGDRMEILGKPQQDALRQQPRKNGFAFPNPLLPADPWAMIGVPIERKRGEMRTQGWGTFQGRQDPDSMICEPKMDARLRPLPSLMPKRMGLREGHSGVFLPSSRRPENPEWCRSFYRPRRLTHDGSSVLRLLDPDGMGKVEPLILGEVPHASLKARERFLARRYTAIDLLMKGYAFEEVGQYFHISKIREREELRNQRLAQLGGADSSMPTEQHLLQWIGVLRRASWEQLFAIEPYAKRSLVDRVDDLCFRGFLSTAPIHLGRGEVETITLTKKGMKAVMEWVPQAEMWGWGPRKPLPDNREYHEQVVGDAVAYQIHAVTADMKTSPSSVWLDRGLRRLCQGMESVPDVRIGFELLPGIETYFDVEAEGIGTRYRASGHEAKLQGAKIFRVFSTTGGKVQGGNHVLIGR